MQTVKEAASDAAESVKGAAEKLTGSNKQKQEQEKGELQAGGGMHAEATFNLVCVNLCLSLCLPLEISKLIFFSM
jgi:hypothetical protein